MKYISLVLFAIFLGLQYQIWFHNQGLKKQYDDMTAKAKAAENQNIQLKERNIALKAEVDDLKNGYEAVTEIARNQLHYIQSGETFYRVQ